MLEGTEGNDKLLGKRGSDLIFGLQGDDVLDGGTGDDELNGGEGRDTALYETSPAGVTVNLSTGRATDKFENNHTLVEIENIIGSDFSDNLVGDERANSLTGRDGSDSLAGRGGNDLILGGADQDTLNGGAGQDSFFFLNLIEGGDTIEDFEVGSDLIRPSAVDFGSQLKAGELPESQFVEGTEATNDQQRFVYDSKTGELFFDSDGNGSATQELIVTLEGAPALTAREISPF